MSIIWQLEINGVKLFTKLSPTNVQCNICKDSGGNPKKFNLPLRSTTRLHGHVSKHNEYKKQYNELKAIEDKKKEMEKQAQMSIRTFTSNGKSLNSLTYILFRHSFWRSQSNQLHLRDESTIYCR
jgi:hypothetical protein